MPTDRPPKLTRPAARPPNANTPLASPPKPRMPVAQSPMPMIPFAGPRARRVEGGGPGAGSSERALVELLEAPLDVSHEAVGLRPIHQPVVEAEREVGHGPNGDGVVANHRPLLDRAHSQNRHLRLVDAGGAEQAPEDAGVGYGERAPLHVLDLEPLAAVPLHEGVHGPGLA